ncbi:MAG: RtcB family protein [Elusimicrobia bacterium]|nr:RtcB family protein [Elusimicrobiota bacterium]
MPVAQTIGSTPVPVKVWTKDVDSASLDQLKNIARLPFVFHHVAAMADVHLGIGATVGSVVATKGAVVPAAVGVDIGCGMAAMKLPFIGAALEGKLHDLRRAIERVVPVGFESHRDPTPESRGWKRWEDFHLIHQKAQDLKKKAMCQLGTLGGGNHFIELCLDEGGAVWLMLHSGSRNLGKSLAEIHIDQAKSVVKKLAVALPDRDLAYFASGTPEFSAYMRDLHFCQDYAAANRKTMLSRILRELAIILNDGREIVPESEINCHHNYAVMEKHFGEEVLVTRKGAVRAGKGDMGIIPGSMGTRSYIVRGKGNPESFDSCSHGAGRRMSRHEAKRRFSVADLQKQTAGVECRKDAGVLDEIPSAYKPIDEVMANQRDLVEIVASLKQVLCVKG